MSIIKKIKFSANVQSDFSNTLKARVNDYFTENGISRYGNYLMYIKSSIMLTSFMAPLVIIGTGIITIPWLLFLLYIISGFGMAGVGMGVMHDAIHGSYSNSRTVNQIMSYTMNLIGANATVWKIQHNVLHHTYTNIDEADDDLNPPFFLRFSPHAEKHWLHKFQFIYVWFFYGLSTLSWVTTKDFVRLNRYHNMGFLNKKGEYRNELLKLIGWKLLYYSFALILPLIMVPLSPLLIVMAFLVMHFVTGLSISMVFQAAHIVPHTEFPLAGEDGQIEADWTFHQLATTCNFAARSRIFTWLIGGLNYQIEHHLMPHICHVHYRKLAPIVQQTAKEFGMPYYSEPTFVSALSEHTKMLYKLGR